MKKAIFPGSFDPFTIGHYSIVKRALSLFDEIIIAVGVNQTKKPLFDIDKRIDIIKQSFSGNEKVKVYAYNCLTVDLAQEHQAQYILRGLRSVSDFEYERTVADANKKLTGIETVMLFTDTQYSFVSSTVVRDLLTYNKDISMFLPPNVNI